MTDKTIDQMIDDARQEFLNNFKLAGYPPGDEVLSIICFNIGTEVVRKHYEAEIEKLKQANSVMREAMEWYSGQSHSDIELDIFDHFKCDHKGNSEFNSDWLCTKARQALKQVEELEDK